MLYPGARRDRARGQHVLKGTVTLPLQVCCVPWLPSRGDRPSGAASVLTHGWGSRPARAGLVPGTLRTVSTRLQCLQCPPLLHPSSSWAASGWPVKRVSRAAAEAGPQMESARPRSNPGLRFPPSDPGSRCPFVLRMGSV